MITIVDELLGLDPSPRVRDLIAIALGHRDPPRHSRLGAFKATLGYAEGTVGRGANRAIAAIYISLGTVGEDRIGAVFNSPEAMALFPKDGCGPASRRLAEIEYAYWRGQNTIGGYMGSAFPPSVRAAIQCAGSAF